MVDLKALERRVSDLVCGNRVVFHHLPKCGGTSVYRAIRFFYTTSYSYIDLTATYRAIEALNADLSPDEVMFKTVDFREEQFLMYLFMDRRLVAGPIPFSNDAHRLFQDRYKFITTLRDPVSLFFSTYFWNKTSPEPRWRIEQSIEEFLETPRARTFGCSYSSFFNGLPPQVDPLSRESIDAAKENLRKFSVVGIVEDMPTFERRLREHLNIRIRIGHKNKGARTSEDARAKAVTPEVKRKIEEISAVNREIYDFAVREFADRA